MKNNLNNLRENIDEIDTKLLKSCSNASVTENTKGVELDTGGE